MDVSAVVSIIQVSKGSSAARMTYGTSSPHRFFSNVGQSDLSNFYLGTLPEELEEGCSIII